jgi:hypothetical protein
MPVELAPFVDLPVPPRSPLIYPPRKRWTRAECESIEARDRLELIEGELMTKLPKNRAHMIVFMSVMKWLVGLLDPLYLNLEGSDRCGSGGQSQEPARTRYRSSGEDRTGVSARQPAGIRCASGDRGFGLHARL